MRVLSRSAMINQSLSFLGRSMTMPMLGRSDKVAGLRRFSSLSTPVRWGILSAGKIASDFCKAISITEGAEATAVAARQLSRARDFAIEHQIDRAYGSYQELLQDEDIHVVYVGSVADQHAALAEECIRAGKATVVEKPFTLSYKDSKALIELAKSHKCFLMEGMWTRCFPATKKVRQLIGSGAIGRPVLVQGDFGWSTAGSGPNDRIWKPDSGGMLLDIAMYLAQWGQVAFGSNSQVNNIQTMGTLKNGVDHTTVANCQYEFEDHGQSQTGFLQMYVTGEANTEERLTIQGTKGRIIVESPAHVPERVRLEVDQGRGINDVQVFEYPLPNDSFTTWNYPGSIGFTHEIRAVNGAVRRGLLECPDYTWNDSLQVATMLEVMRAQVLRDNSDTRMTVEDEETAVVAQ